MFVDFYELNNTQIFRMYSLCINRYVLLDTLSTKEQTFALKLMYEAKVCRDCMLKIVEMGM